MIKDFEFYHGTVLTRLIHKSQEALSIKTYPSTSNASYILNERIGLYIKHCAKRLSPWTFSMQKDHQDEILKMRNELDEVFLILVCGKDGIVSLDFKELKRILNEVHDSIEWVRVSRNRWKEYSIKGSDGALDYKIGKSNFPKKVLEFKIIDKAQKRSQKIHSWSNALLEEKSMTYNN